MVYLLLWIRTESRTASRNLNSSLSSSLILLKLFQFIEGNIVSLILTVKFESINMNPNENGRRILMFIKKKYRLIDMTTN